MKAEDGTGSRHPSWRCGNSHPTYFVQYFKPPQQCGGFSYQYSRTLNGEAYCCKADKQKAANP